MKITYFLSLCLLLLISCKDAKVKAVTEKDDEGSLTELKELGEDSAHEDESIEIEKMTETKETNLHSEGVMDRKEEVAKATLPNQKVEEIKKEQAEEKSKIDSPEKKENKITGKSEGKVVVSTVINKSEKEEVIANGVIETSKASDVKKDEVKVIFDKPEKFSHELFDLLVSNHISSLGAVDYKAFKKDEGKLDSYLSFLERTKLDSDWSKNKKLAFWINLYNASTIKLIIENYPLKSIMNLDGGKVWDRSWVKHDGKTYSLNDIEHKIIRPQFNEPRIHFAVNCAAKSCPPIWNRAWTESNVTKTLEQVTKSFINNSNYNQLNGNKASLSNIFEWYASDFGDVVSYINKYAKDKLSPDCKLSYLEYDWSLNGK